jgi:hypothetical protein
MNFIPMYKTPFCSYVTAAHGVQKIPARDDSMPLGSHYHKVWRLSSLGFCSLMGLLFQLAVSPFNWIDKVMEDVRDKGWGACLMLKPPMIAR